MKFLANMRIGRKLALSFVGLAALAVIGIGSSLRGRGSSTTGSTPSSIAA